MGNRPHPKTQGTKRELIKILPVNSRSHRLTQSYQILFGRITHVGEGKICRRSTTPPSDPRGHDHGPPPKRTYTKFGMII